MSISAKKQDQQGMVSIIVTMIIMIILGLIILGFAQLSRREQRQSLDRQLAVQAQYAAESGINQISKYVKDSPSTSWDDCNDSVNPSLNPPFNMTINESVQYTCILVNPQPEYLEYQASSGDSSVFPIIPRSGNLNSITIGWTDDSLPARNYSNCPTSIGEFPTNPNWTSCDAAVLQVDLVPISSNYSSGSLINAAVSFVLEPSRLSSTINSMPVSGDTLGVICNSNGNPKDCTVTIPVNNSAGYYAKIQRHYRSANVRISARNGAAIVPLVNAQAEVDVTAKATDVLKRLVARVSLNDLNNSASNTVPNNALSTGQSICKRFGIIPGNPGTLDIDTTDSSCSP